MNSGIIENILFSTTNFFFFKRKELQFSQCKTERKSLRKRRSLERHSLQHRNAARNVPHLGVRVAASETCSASHQTRRYTGFRTRARLQPPSLTFSRLSPRWRVSEARVAEFPQRPVLGRRTRLNSKWQ